MYKIKTWNIKLFFIILWGIINSVAFSQEKVKGQIVNNLGDPMPFALIAEMLPGMNYVGNMTQSDSTGNFVIDLRTKESYLYVTYMGYKPQNILSSDLDSNGLLRIVLEPDPTFTLNEVVITANRQAAVLTNDRLIYDMSANPLKEGNTLQALRFVPFIVADDNSFSIIGKENTIVYINNRRSNITPSGLLIYLRSLPADNIRSIEVITNPGSTFRGEGNFGVVNIRLKENENEGLRGNISGRLWKTHYFKESGTLNLNYTRGKTMTNFSAGLGNYSTWRRSYVESSYIQNTLTTRREALYDSRQPEFFANLQSDYLINKNSTFGFIINTSLSDSKADETGLTSFGQNLFITVDSLIDMNTIHKRKSTSFSINTNYRFNSDDQKQSFMVDIDYMNNNNRNYSKNIMNYLNPDMSINSGYLNFEQEVPQTAQILSGKVEYGKKINQVTDIKLGFDTYYSIINNDNKYRVWNTSGYVEDPLRSNFFEVKESTSALFTQIDRELSAKLSTSIGARFEFTDYKGTQHTTDEHFNTDYFRVLPSFRINYRPSNLHRFNYSTSYRISRPSFRNLNPFIQYTSPVNYFVGNPFLKPAGYFYQQLDYGLNNQYFLSASFNITDNIVNPIQILKENGMIENTLVNMGKENTFYIWFSTSQRYLKGRAGVNFSLAYGQKQVKGSSQSGALDYSHRLIGLSIQNNLTVSQKHNLAIDFGYQYNSKNRNAYLTFPSTLNLNGQIRKGIKDFQLSVYANISSYIYDSRLTQVWKLERANQYLNEIEYSKGESTSIGLSISYNFGNSRVQGVNRRNTSNSEVRPRVQ